MKLKRRPLNTRSGLLSILLLVSVCSRAHAEPWGFGITPTPEKVNTSDTVIILKRTACYGTCPIYKLTIYGDGEVLFEGEEYVKVEGRARGNISPEKVTALLKEFDAINFWSLSDDYSEYGKGCPTAFADLSGATILLRIKDRENWLWHDHGCRGDPMLEKLTNLENRIDEAAKSKQWVGR